MTGFADGAHLFPGVHAGAPSLAVHQTDHRLALKALGPLRSNPDKDENTTTQASRSDQHTRLL